MMAVSVNTRPELNAGDIAELFEGDYWGFGTPRPDYHVTADRSRFLMLTGGAGYIPAGRDRRRRELEPGAAGASPGELIHAP